MQIIFVMIRYGLLDTYPCVRNKILEFLTKTKSSRYAVKADVWDKI